MSDTDDFLEHFGIKGMRWGHRKTEDSGSSSSSGGTAGVAKAKAVDPVELALAQSSLRGFAEKNGGGAAVMAAKYGPPGTKALPTGVDGKQVVADKSFYERNEKAIKIGGAVAVAGLLAYGGYKYQQSAGYNKAVLWNDYNNKSLHKGKPVDVNSLSTTPLNLKAGTIVKRISTKDEKEIRPGGFFAAHDDEDVSRYKAILPTFWNQWGLDAKQGGYVVNYKAQKDIKAPSERAAYDMYAGLLKKDKSFLDEIDPFDSYKGDTARLARDTWKYHSASWADASAVSTNKFFAEAKSQGYNALIDSNDAGSLSKTPVRYLDGSMFTVEPSQRLTRDEIERTQISEAQKIRAARKR